MLRSPIEKKLAEKTDGRYAMKEFLERILKVEEIGKQYSNEYKSGIKKAVNKEKQMED